MNKLGDMSLQICHFFIFNFHFYFLIRSIESAADAQISEIIDELAISGSVVDPHHVDADPDAEPDSTYHPDADSDFFLC